MTATLVQSKSATGTSGTSLTVTLNSPTTAGNCLIACAGTVDATNPTISGITLGGSAGNWASGNTAYNNSYINAGIWIDPNCAGGQTSVVISFAGDSGGGPVTDAWVMEWSGLALTSPVDKAPAGSNGGASSWSSGSTGTLSQANELAIGVVYYQTSGSLTTPGSPWTELAQVGATNLLGVGYQVVSATTALTYSGTGTGGGSYGTCILTLKVAATTPVSGSDTGSGADSSSITATLPTTADTGSGADVGVIDQPGTETGSGADSGSLTASVPGAEAGTGADTSTITVASSDTGSGADSGSATFGALGLDTGTGSESAAITAATILGTDTGSGAESSSIHATLPAAADTGSGADAATVGIASGDTASGAEGASHVPFVAPPLVLWRAADKLSLSGGVMK